MPKRPTSHQIEDQSRKQFDLLLPATWVSRTKSHDYGIDLEVELFDRAGDSTGLIFYVQLRATDDPKKSERLQISAEQLEYFYSLPIPTIVVRYFRPANTFRWKWHYDIPLSSGQKAPKSKTVQLDADTIWSDRSAQDIATALENVRSLKALREASRIPIAPVFDGADPNRRYDLEIAYEQALKFAPILATQNGPFGIELRSDGISMRLEIAHVRSLDFSVEGLAGHKLIASILYGTAVILRECGVIGQASQAALAALSLREPATDPNLALRALLAVDDPRAAADLAILNGLADRSGLEQMLAMLHLTKSRAPPEVRAAAVRLFQLAVLSSPTAKEEPLARAAAHYSIGNFERSQGHYSTALLHYNRARKLRPAYMQSEYFLKELGSVLFLRGKYRCAAGAYAMGLHGGDPPRDHFLLGDALLLSGSVEAAALHFARAVESEDMGLNAEASLKLFLCEWLIGTYGNSSVPTMAESARRRMASREDGHERPDILAEVVSKHDTLNQLANFNLGISAVGDENWEAALAHFLIVAFKQPNDTEAWVNALISAHKLGDTGTFGATFATALSLGGSDVYSEFRKRPAPEETAYLGTLDQMRRDVAALLEKKGPDEMTIRILGDNGPEPVWLTGIATLE